MSKFTINFENEQQYKNFINSIKDEVINELKPRQHLSSNWVNVRKQMEERFRKDNYKYAENCGWWHTQMQAIYAVYRLAFQRPSVAQLGDVDGDRLQNLHDELFDLIDKYREETK